MADKHPLKIGTLHYLIRKKEVLLALKKRGFGKGMYNGIGGKVKRGESIIKTLKRETFEEIGVIPKDIVKMGLIKFKIGFENWDMNVYVYISKSWEGKPKETDEMKPKWFPLSALPYRKMWPDDSYWMPLMLGGKQIKAEFVFDKNRKIKDFKIEPL